MTRQFTSFYTPHVMQNGIKGAVFPLEQFEEIMASNIDARALGGMKLLAHNYESTVVSPKYGSDWLRIDRNCSWLHTQNGYICAGAGGVNSSPVRKIKAI